METFLALLIALVVYRLLPRVGGQRTTVERHVGRDGRIEYRTITHLS